MTRRRAHLHLDPAPCVILRGGRAEGEQVSVHQILQDSLEDAANLFGRPDRERQPARRGDMPASSLSSAE